MSGLEIITVCYPGNTKVWIVECILNSSYIRVSLDWPRLIYTSLNNNNQNEIPTLLPLITDQDHDLHEKKNPSSPSR